MKRTHFLWVDVVTTLAVIAQGLFPRTWFSRAMIRGARRELEMFKLRWRL